MKTKLIISAIILMLGFSFNSYAGGNNTASEDKTIIELTDADFAKVTSKGIILVDFWAIWCGPCRMQGKILKELAPEIEGKAQIGKVNIDVHKNASQKYFVRSIPTMLLFKDGKIVKRYVGVQSKDVLLRDILNATK